MADRGEAKKAELTRLQREALEQMARMPNGVISYQAFFPAVTKALEARGLAVVTKPFRNVHRGQVSITDAGRDVVGSDRVTHCPSCEAEVSR